MVRVPDAAGQLRSAPIRLLRAFFSGIGQMLLAADRLHAEGGKHERFSRDDQLGPPTGLDNPHTTRLSGQASMPARRSFDSTRNVRLLTPDDPAETIDNIRRPKLPRARPRTTAHKRTSGTRNPAGKHRVGRSAPGPATPSAALSSAAAQAELLMPGYEGLSLPAIRARLRGLDKAQLRILLACEKSSANRADIVTLFERRLARLEAAERHAT